MEGEIKENEEKEEKDIEKIVELIKKNFRWDVEIIGKMRLGKSWVRRIEIGEGILFVGIEEKVVKIERKVVMDFDIDRRKWNSVNMMEEEEEKKKI